MSEDAWICPSCQTKDGYADVMPHKSGGMCSKCTTWYPSKEASNIKVIPLTKKENKSAEALLEEMIVLVKSGEVESIGIAFVHSDGGIEGKTSATGNKVLLWAALEHAAKLFYKDIAN